MAAKNKMTVSVQPTARRLTAAERRAARTGTLATQQATLKQEAADRRRKRAEDAETVPSKSRSFKTSSSNHLPTTGPMDGPTTATNRPSRRADH
jgi:hypothetical protein